MNNIIKSIKIVDGTHMIHNFIKLIKLALNLKIKLNELLLNNIVLSTELCNVFYHFFHIHF